MLQLFRNPLVALVVPGLLLVVGGLSTVTDTERQERQALARDTAQTSVRQQLEANQQAAKDRLAVSRYQGTCVYVPETPLVAGLVLLGEHGQPLPEGTAACDAFGGTVVVKDGVTADLATTGNETVVRQFLGW